MSAEPLVKMANDIGDYFATEPDHAAAIASVAMHIRSYWEPRMRKQIFAHLDAGGAGLSGLARAAIQRLVDKERATVP